VAPVASPVRVVRPVPVPVTTAVGRSLGVFVITCYDLTGRTASGAGTSMATVAVDPSVIPLGTGINIQGVGIRVAQDTGGAIRGHRLDLWEPSYAACMAWGVQSRQVSLAG
jgi:N-acetylmuramoyl-L-alanine amidase